MIIYEQTVLYYFCGICEKEVHIDCIECSLCNKWIHRHCAKLSKQQLKVKSHINQYWYCSNCLDCLPFNNMSNKEIKYTFSDSVLNEKLFNYRRLRRL